VALQALGSAAGLRTPARPEDRIVDFFERRDLSICRHLVHIEARLDRLVETEKQAQTLFELTAQRCRRNSRDRLDPGVPHGHVVERLHQGQDAFDGELHEAQTLPIIKLVVEPPINSGLHVCH
jgi:hypothetical protein